jgi:hypothetical protein
VISAAAGVQPQTTDVLTPQSSFHWGDAGVGVGVGIGAALVAFATGLVMLRRRDRLVF